MKGKHICQRLKEIRIGIAQANEIDYTPAECTHKGDCAGTCPACENEMRYIERQLLRRQTIGKAAIVAGLTLGATSIAPAMAQTQQVQPNTTVAQLTEPKLVDCAPNDTAAIIVRGRILCESDREPAIGATILLLDKDGRTTKSGTITNVDGLFAIRVSKDSKVQISFIGYQSETMTFNKPEDDLLIMLKEDKNALMGDVIIIKKPMPDVDADIYEMR